MSFMQEMWEFLNKRKMFLILLNYFLGNAEVIKVLIEHGANVTAENKNKNTPLHEAALNGDFGKNLN